MLKYLVLNPVKCEIEFKEDLTSIPIEDLNVYRVIFVDNGFYARIDFRGVPHYISLLNGKLTVYSKELLTQRHNERYCKGSD